MQGLVNFTTAIADGISVMLPAFSYFMALSCFTFFAWTLYAWSQPHRHHHHHWHKPWVPVVSIVLCGVFATFPNFLTMANVSMGTNMVVSITQYTPTQPPNVGNVLGHHAAAERSERRAAVPVFLRGVRRGLRVLGANPLARHRQRPCAGLADLLRNPVSCSAFAASTS